jgi:hypothetical protein
MSFELRRFAAATIAGLLLAAPAGVGAQSQDTQAGGNGETAEDTGGSELDVDQAWENAKRDWRDLQEASGDAWDDAKQEFEESWSRLQRALSGADEAVPPPDPSAGDGSDAEAGGSDP